MLDEGIRSKVLTFDLGHATTHTEPGELFINFISEENNSTTLEMKNLSGGNLEVRFDWYGASDDDKDKITIIPPRKTRRKKIPPARRVTIYCQYF